MLSPRQLVLLTSFKASLSAVIALGIAMALGWERPYWAAVTTMIVTLPYMGAALEKSMMRAVGTFAGGVVAYIINGAFIQNQVGFCLLLAFALIVSGYFSTGTWYPYTFFLFGVTLTIILAESFQSPHMLWNTMFFRTSEVYLGILVALAVNAVFWPQHAGRALMHKAANELDKCHKIFRSAVDSFYDNAPVDTKIDELENAIAGVLAEMHPLLYQAQRDSSHVNDHVEYYQDMLRCLEDLYITLSIFRKSVQIHYPKAYAQEFKSEAEEFSKRIDQLFLSLSSSLRTGKPIEAIDVQATGDAVDAKIEQLRDQDVNLKYPIEDTTHCYAVLANQFDVSQVLAKLRLIVDEINGPAHRLKKKHKEKKKASIDKMRLKHAIKIALTCIVSIYAWQWLQWPGGSGAIFTAVIVLQMTIVASNKKALQRLGGCVIGGSSGALALIFLEPHFSNYLTFAVPLFFFFFLFAMMNYGSKNYSYAGFQSFLTFLLMTSISNTQNTNLMLGIDRLQGIVLGVVIGLIVLRLIWPVIPERELNKSFALFFNRAAAFLEGYTPTRMAGHAADDARAILVGKVSPVAASVETWLAEIAMNNESLERNRIRKLALSAQSISLRLRGLEQAFQAESPKVLMEKITPSILEINESVVGVLKQLEVCFKQGKPVEFAYDLDKPLRNLTQALYRIFRQEHAGREFSGKQVASVLRIARRYRMLAIEARDCVGFYKELDYSKLQRTPFF